MKIHPVGAGLFHADGRTDRETERTNMTKLIVAFCNFANAPNASDGLRISCVTWERL